VSTSITSRGLGENLLSQIRASNPDIVHARSDERGYVLLDVKAERMVAEMRTTANPVKADAVLGVQARFEIGQGVAGVHKL
jgi:alkaline phosphatase D